MSRKRILVLGGGGFIGNHLVTALVAAAEIMRNSSQINTAVLSALKVAGWPERLFYSSSACVYPDYNQEDPDDPICTEASVYPAAPDSEYGWEKLFAERLYLAHARNYGCTIRIGRFHAIYGPGDDFEGGREKVISALCRKVYQASTHIDVWGDGRQTRSFLYIEDLIKGLMALMASDEARPTNIGSEDLISINDLAQRIINVAGKDHIAIKNIMGPQGVRGRRSDNAQMLAATGWKPEVSLEDGLIETYDWIAEQLNHRS